MAGEIFEQARQGIRAGEGGFKESGAGTDDHLIARVESEYEWLGGGSERRHSATECSTFSAVNLAVA